MLNSIILRIEKFKLFIKDNCKMILKLHLPISALDR